MKNDSEYGKMKVMNDSLGIDEFKHLRIWAYLAAAGLFNGLSWVASELIKSRAVSDLIILHYTVDFGVDFIGEDWRIFLFPTVGAAVILFNFILAALLRRQSIFLYYLLIVGAVAFNLILIFVLISLYLINNT